MIYGPNTTAVQSIIDRVARMTDDEIQLLDAAWDSTGDPVRDVSWDKPRTPGDAMRNAVRDVFWDAGKDAGKDAVNDAVNDAVRDEAWDAAADRAIDAHWDASLGEAWDAAKAAARDAGKDADWGEYLSPGLSPGLSPAWATILAALTYDLATIEGPYTIFQRDLLMAPWVSVYGMPEGLIESAAT